MNTHTILRDFIVTIWPEDNTPMFSIKISGYEVPTHRDVINVTGLSRNNIYDYKIREVPLEYSLVKGDFVINLNGTLVVMVNECTSISVFSGHIVYSETHDLKVGDSRVDFLVPNFRKIKMTFKLNETSGQEIHIFKS